MANYGGTTENFGGTKADSGDCSNSLGDDLLHVLLGSSATSFKKRAEHKPVLDDNKAVVKKVRFNVVSEHFVQIHLEYKRCFCAVKAMQTRTVVNTGDGMFAGLVCLLLLLALRPLLRWGVLAVLPAKGAAVHANCWRKLAVPMRKTFRR